MFKRSRTGQKLCHYTINYKVPRLVRGTRKLYVNELRAYLPAREEYIIMNVGRISVLAFSTSYHSPKLLPSEDKLLLSYCLEDTTVFNT